MLGKGSVRTKIKNKSGDSAFDLSLLSVLGSSRVCSSVRVWYSFSLHDEDEVLFGDTSVRAAECSMWTGSGERRTRPDDE